MDGSSCTSVLSNSSIPRHSPWTTLAIPSSSPRLLHFKPPHSTQMLISTIHHKKEEAQERRGSCLQVYHDFEFEVRDYELDQYGVVNNAVYSQYMEHGYIKMLEKIGVDFVSDGYFAATYEKYLKFTAPLKRKDRFVVKVKVEKVSSTRLFFECVMLKLPNREVIIGDHIHLLKILMNCFPSVAHQLVLEGRSTIVWLDKNYRPIRVPFEVR